MAKIKADIIAVGDRVDRDSFKKFHREHKVFGRTRMAYQAISYKELFAEGVKPLKSGKAFVFLFFPFDHWNTKIEPPGYRGVYGNKVFYDKFKKFFRSVDRALSDCADGREIIYVNHPDRAAGFRDRIKVMRALEDGGISTPGIRPMRRAADIYRFLNSGRSLFIKVRYGSMGKGITYISPSAWKTNFSFRKKKILSRKSDHGWHFRDIVRREDFINKLMGSDVYCEEAIDPYMVKGKKFDLRVYVLYGEALFIYPRTAGKDSVTTNISQGGKGERPAFLRALPARVIKRVKAEAIKVADILGLNFAGVDIIVDKDLKGVYVLDVNMFPGFPKRKIYNLGRRLALKLKYRASL
jgi:glutathione synthase/RimK-type ligase-like ATP-grasp enzyme